jgi:carbamate kinase
MRLLVALGGNALLRRGEALSAAVQRRNVRAAAAALAPLAQAHELIVSHGNGPQVGLLALQSAAYDPSESVPLDVLGAESEGMIGYMIEQELASLLAPDRELATVLTMVEVDPDDPAFRAPRKFIGPVYDKPQAEELAAERGWAIAPDGSGWRRVVASPRPQRILEIRAIEWLLEKGAIVICAGGGGIPTIRDAEGRLEGAEAVIDKDLAGALLAEQLDVDLFVMATDVDAVYLDWGRPEARAIRHVSPEALGRHDFAAGSMGPKVEAACRFVEATGGFAAIGALGDLAAIVAGEAGTRVIRDAATIEFEN